MSNITINVPGMICVVDDNSSARALFVSTSLDGELLISVASGGLHPAVHLEINLDDAETIANAILREVRDLKGCTCLIDVQIHDFECPQKGGI